MMSEIVKIREEIQLALNTFIMSTDQLKVGFISLMTQHLTQLMQEIEKRNQLIAQLQAEIEGLKNPQSN